MNKRDFLKFFGAGLASLPFAGKLLKEGLPEIKSAAKGITRTLSKVEGMPEWFSPLVNKIWKNGKNISPEVKRLEDTVHVRTLKDGDTIFTLTEHPLEGEIRVEIKSPRNPHGEPVELQYKKPKKDFDPDTGKTINEPGEFQVVESEPRWTNSDDPVLELGERVTSVDKAAGDIEAAERAVTGKIKNREKIKERRKIKDQMENNPTDYIDQEYGPEPGFYQQFKNYGDYAKGGIAGFQYGGGAIGYANGGRSGYESGGVGLPPEDPSIEYGQDIKTVPTGFNFAVNRPMPVYQEGQPEISGNFRDLRNYINSSMGNINPQLSYIGDNFGGNVSAMMNPSINAPISYSADAYYGPEQGRFNLGFTTVPTADARQFRAGYEGPYGNISFGASRDPIGNNYMLNYSNRFADGGRVKTHLTRTIPPVRGPMPQGVETLFKRRYR